MSYNIGAPTSDTNRLPVTAGAAQAEATSRSGTITLGGTAQELMPAGASRTGWAIQNQSSADLYVRSRGAAGTTNATADQNSIRVGPGVYYAADYISPNAMSVLGATTGQAFWAREW